MGLKVGAKTEGGELERGEAAWGKLIRKRTKRKERIDRKRGYPAWAIPAEVQKKKDEEENQKSKKARAKICKGQEDERKKKEEAADIGLRTDAPSKSVRLMADTRREQNIKLRSLSKLISEHTQGERPEPSPATPASPAAAMLATAPPAGPPLSTTPSTPRSIPRPGWPNASRRARWRSIVLCPRAWTPSSGDRLAR